MLFKSDLSEPFCRLNFTVFCLFGPLNKCEMFGLFAYYAGPDGLLPLEKLKMDTS